MKERRVTITDHAVLRYLQRVLDIDVEAHRRELGRRINATYREGASGVVINGYSCRIVKDRRTEAPICITVLPGTLLHQKRRRAK